MQSHEVLKDAFDKSTPKAIAADLGVSVSLVYKWAQESSEIGSGSRNPLDRLLEIYKITNHIEIIEWLCSQAGGYFVQENVHSEANQAFDVLPATNEILHQFSELLSEISESAQDNNISPEEASQIRNLWNKLKSYGEGFVTACEHGEFALIKKSDQQPSQGQKPEPRRTLY